MWIVPWLAVSEYVFVAVLLQLDARATTDDLEPIARQHFAVHVGVVQLQLPRPYAVLVFLHHGPHPFQHVLVTGLDSAGTLSQVFRYEVGEGLVGAETCGLRLRPELPRIGVVGGRSDLCDDELGGHDKLENDVGYLYFAGEKLLRQLLEGDVDLAEAGVFDEASQVGARVVGALELRPRRLVGRRDGRVVGPLRHLFVDTLLETGNFVRKLKILHFKDV